MISVTHLTDPGCPWAYSAWPALSALMHRYAGQLEWRHVTIGLTEEASAYEAHGYTGARMAQTYRRFRSRGMPFATGPRARPSGTGRACRAIVATRLADPAREVAVLRALQFAWFTTTLAVDTDDGIAAALAAVPGLDVAAVVGALDSPEVGEAYEADRAEARTAEGSPTHFQGKAAQTDGPVRYTAPSLQLRAGERMLEAGGFQPLEAYDVLIANLDPTLDRNPPAFSAAEALEERPEGLTTREVAACLCEDLSEPDDAAAEDELIGLVAEGRAERLALGDGALWRSV